MTRFAESINKIAPGQRRRKYLSIAAALFAIAPLSVRAEVMMRHYPAHPDSGEPISVAVRASGSVQSITLTYNAQKIVINDNGGTSTLSEEREVIIASCKPEFAQEILWCFGRLDDGFDEGRLVSLTASALLSDGGTQVESYMFAAGLYPIEGDPIPVRTTGPIEGRLDIVLVPARDISLDDFRSKVSSIINDQIFSYEAYRGTPEIAYRKMYNFYYTNEQGNYEERCSFSPPKNFSQISSVGDAIVILHKETLRDCRSGKLISSEMDYTKTMIHELGHVLFDLQDEYCCDSNYIQHAQVPNIWKSKSACEEEAKYLLYPKSFCTQISNGSKKIEFWYIDPAGEPGSIMGSAQHTPASLLLNASMRRVLWRFQRCLEGSCFPDEKSHVAGNVVSEAQMEAPVTPDVDEPRSVLTRFGLDAAIADDISSIGSAGITWQPPNARLVNENENLSVELLISENDAKLLSLSPASSGHAGLNREGELEVFGLDEEGNVLHHQSIHDPRFVEIEGEGWRTIDAATIVLDVPPEEGLTELVIIPADKLIPEHMSVQEYSSGFGKSSGDPVNEPVFDKQIYDGAIFQYEGNIDAELQSGGMRVDLRSELSELCSESSGGSRRLPCPSRSESEN